MDMCRPGRLSTPTGRLGEVEVEVLGRAVSTRQFTSSGPRSPALPGLGSLMNRQLLIDTLMRVSNSLI